MAKLTSITLYDANRNLLSDPGGTPILACVDGVVQRRQALGEAEFLSLKLLPMTPAATTIEGDGFMALRRRRILRLTYDDAAFLEYRITEAVRSLDGESSVSVRAEFLPNAQLAAYAPRQTLADDTVDVQPTFVGLGAQAALDALLSATWGRPAFIMTGTIAAALADTVVEVRSDGTKSFVDLIRDIAEQCEGEVEFAYNSGSGRYAVNIYAEAGWHADERTAGTADPTARPIEIGNSSKGNRQKMLRRSDDRAYLSHVIPIGGQDPDLITLGGALWSVSTSGTGPTTITFTADNPVFLDDALVGAYVGADAVSFFEVTASDRTAGTVTVAGNASALNGRSDIRFASDSGGTQLVALTHPSAVDGTLEKPLRFSGVAPYQNLIADAGASADFSTWSAGLPAGWSKEGTPTVTQDTDARYLANGTSSAKVVASEEEGLSTTVTLTPTTEHPWFSAWVNLRVTSGNVRLVVVDVDGQEHPLGEDAFSTADELLALAIEGFDPISGTATVKVLAYGGGATFYLDGATVVQSSAGYAYSPAMGPRGLWAEAGRYLRANDEYQDAYEAGLLDYSFVDTGGSYYPVTCGSHCSVKDAPNTSGGHDIEFNARAVEVEIDEDAHTGSISRRVGLSRRVKDFRDRFLASRGAFPSKRITPVNDSRITAGLTPYVEVDNLWIEVVGNRWVKSYRYNDDPSTFPDAGTGTLEVASQGTHDLGTINKGSGRYITVTPYGDNGGVVAGPAVKSFFARPQDGNTGSGGAAASLYYIKATAGTAIHNGTGTLTIEAHLVTGGSDSLLAAGTIKLYDPSNQELTVASGYYTGSDGYTGVLDSGDISGAIVITLKDGTGGTPLDTITLVDVADGATGKGYVGTAGPVGIPITWFSQYAIVTIANTGTETSLLGSGLGTNVIPANTLIQGSTFHIRASGIISCDGGNTIVFRVSVGGTNLLVSSSLTPGSYADRHWSLEADLVCTAVTGTTGYMRGQMKVWFRGGPSTTGAVYPTEMSGTVSIGAVTSSKTIEVTADWASADGDDSIRGTNATIQQLY